MITAHLPFSFAFSYIEITVICAGHEHHSIYRGMLRKKQEENHNTKTTGATTVLKPDSLLPEKKDVQN